MPRPGRSFREVRTERLTNPEVASHYLNLALEESPDSFLKALRNVAQARQMTKVAEDAGIQRESLYRALSDEGNPTWETFTSILTAVGLRLMIATPEGLVGPAPPPTRSDSQLAGISSVGERANPHSPHSSIGPKVVNIDQWSSLISSRQKKYEELDESTNEPTLQEALCG